MWEFIDIVDPATGDVVRSGRRQLPDRLTDDGLAVWLTTRQLRQFDDRPLPASLSWDDRGRFAALTAYIGRDGNGILYQRLRRGVGPMGIDDIGRVVDMPLRTAYRLTGRLVDAGVLGRVRCRDASGRWQASYAVNPVYCMRGKRITVQLYLMFRDNIDPLLTAAERALLARDMADRCN